LNQSIKNSSSNKLQNADSVLLAISGMGCENCVTRVRNSLLMLDGVHGADLFLNMAMAEVYFDSNLVSAKTLVAAVAKAGNDGRHQYQARIISM
jgi:copper chaperone CopZ